MQTHDTHFWVAHYSDGSHLAEFDGGREHNLADALAREGDGVRLVEFCLLPHDEQAGLPPYAVRVAEGDRLIFARRRTYVLKPTGEQFQAPSRTILGWKRKLARRTVSSYLTIYPNGTVVLSDRDT